MTVKQAIDEGYKHCSYIRAETLLSIDMDELSLISLTDQYGEIFLAEKECLIEKFPKASDILETIDESIERHEIGLEPTGEIISSYENILQKLLDKMKNEIREKGATKTYKLTDIRLVS